MMQKYAHLTPEEVRSLMRSKSQALAVTLHTQEPEEDEQLWIAQIAAEISSLAVLLANQSGKVN